MCTGAICETQALLLMLSISVADVRGRIESGVSVAHTLAAHCNM